MPRRYPIEIKNEVLRLGKEGLTYQQIREKFPVPKSTLSVWFKNAGTVRDRSRQLEHLGRARLLSVAAKNKQKQQRIEDAEQSAKKIVNSIVKLDKEIVKSLLAMLYWAEGTKGDTSGGPKFVNTDPELALFYIRLLRSSYPIDESRIRVRLQLHYYHDHGEALSFWSGLLMVPESQFGKIYVKNRSTRKKFRENFQGICCIEYYDTRVRRELLAIGRTLARKQDLLSSFNG